MSPRGPYRRKPRLKVDANTWHVGDAIRVGRTTWSIRSIGPDGTVVLLATNHPNSKIRWTTTLDRLPQKAG